MAYNRKKFFDKVREGFGSLDQQQVNGLGMLLDFAESRKTRLADLAYILSTVWWETAKTFQPVREAFWTSESWRRRNLRYYPYYGRGLVQLTWKENYKKVSDWYGVDFVERPDLVMTWRHALDILFDGAEKGWFTGRKLSDTIDDIDDPDDADYKEYYNTRPVINGMDRAHETATAALKFEHALRKSRTTPTVIKDVVTEHPKTLGFVTLLMAAIVAAWEHILAVFQGGL